MIEFLIFIICLAVYTVTMWFVLKAVRKYILKYRGGSRE